MCEISENTEHLFLKYRDNIIGQHETIKTPYHKSIKLLYADWTASGRMYLPIEERLIQKIYPFVANTHTDVNDTSSAMTYAYHKARQIIKNHVGANNGDILISSGSGMTGVVNKLQRILGLRIHESFRDKVFLSEQETPVVFITHMEHHSNHTSWLETIADVVIIPPDENGLVSVANFKMLLQKYHLRKTKIAAVTACSNVTGIMTPYRQIAEMVHRHGGFIFVDFACSAPYVSIDMHPEGQDEGHLDAIYFSPHKFLGGPGATGILIFNRKLYANEVPDNPGGGTVDWTNPWGQRKYTDDIETREDGGTPAFLQTIKAAMCMQLKSEMGVENIQKREEEIVGIIWRSLRAVPNLHILAGQHKKRLGIFSFYIDELHYNLGVKMLNDRFGIQARGGCSCAGTYGHYLLNVTPEQSRNITNHIDMGDRSSKPGWIRVAVHPTHTNVEIRHMADAIRQLAENHKDWSKDYDTDHAAGVIKPKNMALVSEMEREIDSCFTEWFV